MFIRAWLWIESDYNFLIEAPSGVSCVFGFDSVWILRIERILNCLDMIMKTVMNNNEVKTKWQKLHQWRLQWYPMVLLLLNLMQHQRRSLQRQRSCPQWRLFAVFELLLRQHLICLQWKTGIEWRLKTLATDGRMGLKKKDWNSCPGTWGVDTFDTTWDPHREEELRLRLQWLQPLQQEQEIPGPEPSLT